MIQIHMLNNQLQLRDFKKKVWVERSKITSHFEGTFEGQDTFENVLLTRCTFYKVQTYF